MWGQRAALLVTPAAIAVAAGFCFMGKRYIAADMERAEG
jgi:MFS transporter, Spinster family, sphingosine-1-phosphate transporter